MKNVIMIIPIGKVIGLTSICVGLIEKFSKEKLNVGFLKSVFICSNDDSSNYDHTSTLIKNINSIHVFDPFKIDDINSLSKVKIRQKMIDHILLKINKAQELCDLVLVEGMSFQLFDSVLSSYIINLIIAQSIYAKIIFVCSVEDDHIVKIKKIINIINHFFKGKHNINIEGVIINESALTQTNERFNQTFNLFDIFQNRVNNTTRSYFANRFVFEKNNLKVLCFIPWNFQLMEPTVEEIFSYINACIIKIDNISMTRFIKQFVLYESNNNVFKICEKHSESALIISIHCLNNISIFINKVKNSSVIISSVLITNVSSSYVFNVNLINQLKILQCPVFFVRIDTLQVISLLKDFCFKISDHNVCRLNIIKKYFLKYLIDFKINSISNSLTHQNYVSPWRFVYDLKQLAKKFNKNVILPEGTEVRIIKAAVICEKNKLARCTLLGNPKKINQIADLNGIQLNSNITIVDPNSIRENYIKRLVDLRHKNGMNFLKAKQCLNDNLILSTLILESGQVDGLVAGSINTTASTILPAFQLIKTSPGSSLISSVFFMLLSDRVLLYADCAINPNPDFMQLAEIAIQSADTAFSFGLLPKIAMLSYSSGMSGSGDCINKVRKATETVKQLRPNLIIDGPIQYDAAIDVKISKMKLPSSAVLGNANIFIFPDLNSGNITYKAVQRSNNIISIGPILQGIKKPVNDLSRGSSIDDIVYTITVTAVQSGFSSLKLDT